MGAFATIAYGVMVYLLFLATFLYANGFDLVAQFGERYRVYRRQLGMVLPRPRKKMDEKLAE